jgi:hypothetical protein
MLISRKQRIAALERAQGRLGKCRVEVFFLVLTSDATPEQIAALRAAKAAGRPVLTISGVMPDLPADYGLIVEAVEYDGSGSPSLI